MIDYITLDHGSGGKLTHELIDRLFVKNFKTNLPLTDSAILGEFNSFLAFTTDSYVIDPIFFPGGDIGKLAVCGTVNDLAVSGANPKYISASFIIEEGFPYKDIEIIVASMAKEAEYAGVKIVAGDTKVVEKGKCDKIFITTSGIGLLHPSHQFVSTGDFIKAGDKIIVNGNMANHAIAVLSARKDINFDTPVISDCASLNLLIKELLDRNISIKFMRDLTRGGLATVLVELAKLSGKDIFIDENCIPIEEPVRGICEILGFDPLYLANEGKVVFVVGENEVDTTLKVLKSNMFGVNSQVIGEFTNSNKGDVILSTSIGGKRILDFLTGMQLPRIC